MEVKLPVKNLIRLSCLLTAVISAIVYLFLYQVKTEAHQILFTVMTAVAVGLIGFANTGALVILAKMFDTESAAFKRCRYLFSYVASATVYLTLWPIFAHFAAKAWSYTDMAMLFTFICSSAVVNTMIIILQDFIMLLSHKSQTDLEFSKLKTAHAEAANLLLKQQIQPHFLFNALNTLKALYRKDPGAGDAYIVHLANFLRASVYSHDARVSRLEDEVALLTDYLEMQRIRFGAALVCLIDLPEKIRRDYYLPSFSLQPLLENAIKHNDLTLEAPLTVHVFSNDGRIIVSNNLQKKSTKLFSANHGLANLAERYRLWSGDEIIIKEDKEVFSVSIKLLTNEHSDHRG